MDLSEEAQQILAYLRTAPRTYFLGTRMSNQTPFKRIDGAIIQIPDSWPLVSRRAIQELAGAGYLSDSSESGRTVNVRYVLSDKARALFSGHQ
jgi:hypothetical protein